MNKEQLIRGARIEQQLNETTYAELERNTLQFIPSSKKRQHDVDQVQVTKLELVPAVGSQNLTVKGEINSHGNIYNPRMLFDGVIFEDSDQADNISFVAADQEEYHMIPVELLKQNVKVACDCLDFYYRFATSNSARQSLDGKAPPPYQKRTERPPVNPQNKPGVCKHLLKLAVQLKDSGVVR